MAVTVAPHGPSPPENTSRCPGLDQRSAERSFVLGQGDLDGLDRVGLVDCWGQVERVLDLREVVPAAGQYNQS